MPLPAAITTYDADEQPLTVAAETWLHNQLDILCRRIADKAKQLQLPAGIIHVQSAYETVLADELSELRRKRCDPPTPRNLTNPFGGAL